MGVRVGVNVGVNVGVLVGVKVGVKVGVFVGVFVAVLTGVLVGVLVGVKVGVFVAVKVGVLVGVTVGVGVHATIGTLCAAPPPIACPLSVPAALIKSAQVPTVQLGAVSDTVPEQLLPALPEGASVVVGLPAIKQGTAVVTPPVQSGGSGQGTVFVTERPVTELTVSWFETVNVQLKGTPATWGLTGHCLVTPMPAAAEA